MDWITGSVTWIASIVGISGLGWLFRSWISTRLTNAVRHEYDTKLEAIKSDLKKQEASFEDELGRQSDQLSAIQSSALGIASQQNQLLESRRIESIERIWKSVVSLAGQKTAAKMMQSVNFDFAVNEAPKDPKIREMFTLLNQSFKIGPEGMSPDSTDTCRLYVSEETWATFSAYKQVLFFAVMKMKMLEMGYDGTKMIKTEEIADMVRAVLPHQSEFIDKYGVSSLDYLVEEIESKLFKLLKDELRGTVAGKESADRAAEIMNHAQKTHLDGAAQQVGALDALTGASDR
jgi:hypothetical protein